MLSRGHTHAPAISPAQFLCRSARTVQNPWLDGETEEKHFLWDSLTVSETTVVFFLMAKQHNSSPVQSLDAEDTRPPHLARRKARPAQSPDEPGTASGTQRFVTNLGGGSTLGEGVARRSRMVKPTSSLLSAASGKRLLEDF